MKLAFLLSGKKWTFAALACMLLLTACAQMKSPKATKGQLDLRSWDFNSRGIVKLDGEWEFYFGQLVPPSDFIQDQAVQLTGYMIVPGVWSAGGDDERPFQPKGCATYRLRLLLPDTTCQYAFKLLDAATAYRIYVNGQPVALNGTVSCTKDNARAEYRPQMSLLPPGICDTVPGRSKYLDIVVHVSNHHHIKAGLWESIRFGPVADIVENSTGRVTMEMAVLSVIMIMVLYHLGLYLLRRRDPSTLLFSLMGLVLGVRELVMGERMLVQWIPHINFQLLSKIEYISSYTNITFIALFVGSLFPGDMPRWMRNLYIAIGVFIALLVGSMPDRKSVV